jgi:CubicO group peptidase (beta-lactamase class C family)
MKVILQILLCFTLFLTAFNSLEAQERKTQQIDSLIKTAYELGIFNGNVLVFSKDKTVYEASFGSADAAKKELLTAEFRFNIGSIAKEFNGVAIMMLKEQGKLKLDDKVSKYITNLPAWADKISIKNLLQYTSGLPEKIG